MVVEGVMNSCEYCPAMGEGKVFVTPFYTALPVIEF